MSDLVEPSDGEQADWPDTTFAYVHGLIGQVEARDARIAELEAHALAMCSAITRPDSHSVMPRKAHNFLKSEAGKQALKTKE